jgi:hypothetical protein
VNCNGGFVGLFQIYQGASRFATRAFYFAIESRVHTAKVLYSFFFAYNGKRNPRTEFESILKYCCFTKAHLLAPTIVELFEDFFLIIGEAFLQVLVMP